MLTRRAYAPTLAWGFAMSRLALVALVLLVSAVRAEERINPDGIDGAVLVVGLDSTPADVKRFTEQAGDKTRFFLVTDKVVNDALPGVGVAVGEASEERAKALTEGGSPAIVFDSEAALLV